MLEDRIEILSVDLLHSEWQLVEEMKVVSENLSLGLGWHYLLDLPWAARQLLSKPNARVLDAGAGIGVMQWWFAQHGVDVISVDRSSRAHLAKQFRVWCTVQGLRPADLQPLPRLRVRNFLPPKRPWQWHRWPRKLRGTLSRVVTKELIPPNGRGTVTIYNQDLSNMTDIPNESVDAVVSISALEHNQPNHLRMVIAELMRVLKPGGYLVATLAASRDRDWFHKPSKGWCYTERTLQQLFGLSPECQTNYDRYDELFQALRNCTELQDNLADIYFKSGENGMPWGKWDPQYLPVGLIKVKTEKT